MNSCSSCSTANQAAGLPAPSPHRQIAQDPRDVQRARRGADIATIGPLHALNLHRPKFQSCKQSRWSDIKPSARRLHRRQSDRLVPPPFDTLRASPSARLSKSIQRRTCTAREALHDVRHDRNPRARRTTRQLVEADRGGRGASRAEGDHADQCQARWLHRLRLDRLHPRIWESCRTVSGSPTSRPTTRPASPPVRHRDHRSNPHRSAASKTNSNRQRITRWAKQTRPRGLPTACSHCTREGRWARSMNKPSGGASKPVPNFSAQGEEGGRRSRRSNAPAQ